MLRAQKRILQKRKLLGTLNINISASLREEKWRWLHFHSWCEHSWGASVSPVSFRAPRATRGNVDVFAQKWRIRWLFREWRRTGTWADFSLSALWCCACSFAHKPRSIHAPIHTSKCRLFKMNHVCYICNRGTGRRIIYTSCVSLLNMDEVMNCLLLFKVQREDNTIKRLQFPAF